LETYICHMTWGNDWKPTYVTCAEVMIGNLHVTWPEIMIGNLHMSHDLRQWFETYICHMTWGNDWKPTYATCAEVMIGNLHMSHDLRQWLETSICHMCWGNDWKPTYWSGHGRSWKKKKLIINTLRDLHSRTMLYHYWLMLYVNNLYYIV
jgi:hypothetical protein